MPEKFAAKRRAWASRPAILNTHYKIVAGDARKLAEREPDGSIHLVVTSPPYWNLKRYPHDRGGAQLGHVDDRKVFLAGLAHVWRECHRLLVPGGRVCAVVGDVCRSRRAFGRHLVEPLHSYVQVQCQEIGFDPLAPIIWGKIGNLATESTRDGATFLGKPYEPNAIIKNDIEFILMFRKPGGYRHPSPLQRDLSVIDRNDHRQWFRQVWSDIPGERRRGHPAPFPTEIARRLFGMFSFVGDTVLDPFWGTGSMTAAAIEMHRSSIGYEIEPQFFEVGRTRIGAPPPGSVLEFIPRKSEPG